MVSNEPSTMHAARVHRFGGPEAVVIEDVLIPRPGPGEVLVRVAAAGVGPWDGWIRAGQSVLPQPLPLTLGSDLSGTVVALGPNVDGLSVGDRVFGVTNRRFTDAYAQFALAEVGMLARKPDALDDIAAASMPVIAVTAWQSLFDHGKLQSGQTVLVHGAAGSVGAYAVQFAHQAGARVIATAAAADRGYVSALGADVVIDYRSERFEDAAADVDLVIDLVGGDVQSRSLAVLKRGSTLVSAVSNPDGEAAATRDVRAFFFLVDVTTKVLGSIAQQVESGIVQTNVGTVLPLRDARLAHEILEGIRPRTRGKIVLRIER